MFAVKICRNERIMAKPMRRLTIELGVLPKINAWGRSGLLFATAFSTIVLLVWPVIQSPAQSGDKADESLSSLTYNLLLLARKADVELKEEQVNELSRNEIASTFYRILSAKVFPEKALEVDEEFFNSLSILTLEFLRELDSWYSVIPEDPYKYKPQGAVSKEPAVNIARLNYSNLTRAWFKKAGIKGENYLIESFTELKQMGLGKVYPMPHEALTPHSYSARLQYMILFDRDKEAMRKALPKIIALFLELAWHMKTVAPQSSSNARILRREYEKLLAEGQAS